MVKRLGTVVALVTALGALAAGAQLSQQGTKLTGTGATGNAWQGSAVAISSDGSTALVGGYLDNNGAGAVWVFTRSNGAWSQQGTKLVGTSATGNANQGWSVALSGDGNTALVGGPADNSGAGAAWVFQRSGASWSQQGNKLVGTGATGAANQGVAVALSSDGNTALVGGPADNTGAGAVWTFARANGTWKQQGSKLVGTGEAGAGGQGSALAISADGSTAAVGGVQDNGGYGAVWVFSQAGGKWTQQGSKLAGSSPNTALRITGNASVTAAFSQQAVPCYTLTANTSPSNEGHITINTPQTCSGGYTPGTQISMLVLPASAWGIVGWSGTGGSFSIVSSYSTTFTIAANASVTATVVKQSGACDTLSVAVNPAAAGTVTIGQTQNCTNGFTQGSSVLLTAEAGYGWTFAGWTSPGGAFADPSARTTRFAISASTTATANFIATPTGCFTLSAVSGSQTAGTVTVNTPQNCPGGYTYGTSVSLTANPAPGYTLSGWSGSGGTLSNPGGIAPGARQGISLALSRDGNTLVAGADVAGSGAGRVWVFTRSGSAWSQQGNPLAAAGQASLAQQSWSASLSGDGNTALIAEPGDNAGEGAAWVFARSAGAWTQQGPKLVGAGAAGNAEQGFAAALSADATTAVVGGPADGGSAGAAWIFAAGATPACTFALSPTLQGFSTPGGRGAFDVGVVSGSGCPWVAVSNAPWITITGAGSGTDAGHVTFAVSTNTGSSRSGTISAAGQTFTAYQAGSNCAYAIDPTSAAFGGAGGSGTFNVTSPAECPWNAATAAAWIHLTAGSGIGAGQAAFTVDANAGGPRVAAIGVEGLTFTVAQAAPVPAPSFTVAPASAVAGEILTFAGASTGAPSSWSWDFGDGSGGAGQFATHTYAAAGTYTAVLTTTNATGQGSASQQVVVATPFARWIPAVSHVDGLNGARWRSAVAILNPGSDPATVQGKLHLLDGVAAASAVIPAGGQGTVADLVAALGATGSGALELLSDRPIVASSRTYNQLASGTVGQEYAAYAPADGLAAGETAYLPELAQNAAYRSNISLTNTGADPAAVTVALFDGLGARLGGYDATVPPGRLVQHNRPFFGYAGQTALDNGYATVTVNSGAGVVATAAVIDNVTNDPTTIAMVPAGSVPAAGSVWVPTVTHVQGAHGTQWRSALALLNPGPADVTVVASLHVDRAVVTAAAPIPAGAQVVVDDIVALFGAGGSGALEIAFDHPLVVSSRTYDQLASGTLGQGYASAPSAAGLSAGQSAWLPQLAENAAVRTNVSLTNTGQAPAAVTVALFDGAGTEVGSYDVTLAPGERAQRNQPYLDFAPGGVDDGYAKVSVVSGGGVVATASVIDNVTSDPTTIAMAR